jgi:hypothetical protein
MIAVLILDTANISDNQVIGRLDWPMVARLVITLLLCGSIGSCGPSAEGSTGTQYAPQCYPSD